MPDPQKLINTIKAATQLVLKQPGRVGKFVELKDLDEVLVVGDLHGHIVNFKKVLQLAKLQENPRRHVIVQELIHGPFRYPNNCGELSHRLVDVVCAFICQYPGRVHYLLGNHELAQWKRREIAKHNEGLNQLFIDGVNYAYPEHTEEVLKLYDVLFEALPVAIRLPNRVFLSHSLPGASRLLEWGLEDLQKETYTEDDYKLGGCVHSVVWGRDTSEETARQYLEYVDADVLISGHIPSDVGFDTPNPVQIILDGKDDNGQILLFPTKEPLNQEELLKKLIKLSELKA